MQEQPRRRPRARARPPPGRDAVLLGPGRCVPVDAGRAVPTGCRRRGTEVAAECLVDVLDVAQGLEAAAGGDLDDEVVGDRVAVRVELHRPVRRAPGNLGERRTELLAAPGDVAVDLL